MVEFQIISNCGPDHKRWACLWIEQWNGFFKAKMELLLYFWDFWTWMHCLNLKPVAFWLKIFQPPLPPLCIFHILDTHTQTHTHTYNIDTYSKATTSTLPARVIRGDLCYFLFIVLGFICVPKCQILWRWADRWVLIHQDLSFGPRRKRNDRGCRRSNTSQYPLLWLCDCFQKLQDASTHEMKR